MSDRNFQFRESDKSVRPFFVFPVTVLSQAQNYTENWIFKKEWKKFYQNLYQQSRVGSSLNGNQPRGRLAPVSCYQCFQTEYILSSLLVFHPFTVSLWFSWIPLHSHFLTNPDTGYSIRMQMKAITLNTVFIRYHNAIIIPFNKENLNTRFAIQTTGARMKKQSLSFELGQ